MACIIINIFVMAFNWFDQPKEIQQVTEVFNYVFIVIFTAEAIIKLIALKSLYFHEGWNIFDFTIVSITLLILFLKTTSVDI